MKYEIRKGSQSAHCCFQYTVVDTTTPLLKSTGEPILDSHGKPAFREICECFDREGAAQIRDALNQTDPN